MAASINDRRRQRERAPSGYPAIPAVHLAIRFLLELAMLAGIWLAGMHVAGWPGAITAVVLAMVLWGVFGTPGDGTRGAPVIPTPGPLRLVLEMILFGVAAFGIWVGWSRAASETFLTVSVLHYLITWERQWWLIRGAPLPYSE